MQLKRNKLKNSMRKHLSLSQIHQNQVEPIFYHNLSIKIRLNQFLITTYSPKAGVNQFFNFYVSTIFRFKIVWICTCLLCFACCFLMEMIFLMFQHLSVKTGKNGIKCKRRKHMKKGSTSI